MMQAKQDNGKPIELNADDKGHLEVALHTNQYLLPSIVRGFKSIKKVFK